MPASSKKSPVLDEIKPLDSHDEEEEKVISVRIPSKSNAAVVSVKEEPKSESSKTEEPDDTEIEDEKPSETTKSETVTSFRTLDTKENVTKDESPVAPVETSEESNEAESTEDASDTSSKEVLSKDKAEEVSKWLEETDTPPTESEGGNKLKIFIIALAIVVLLGIVGGGVYYYQTSLNNQTDEPLVTNTVTTPTLPTTTPTDEPVEVDISELTLQVLNGSGISGEAGRAASALTSAGFGEADAANADSSNYTTTEVSLKEGLPRAVYLQIEEALGDTYVLELSDEELPKDSEYDIQIILGSDEPEAETTSPTPTPKEE